MDIHFKPSHALGWRVQSRKLKISAALLFGCWTVQGAALAQSSRPGWGATPYHDAAGTGVTFRVWAPNATSVYVPGQFKRLVNVGDTFGEGTCQWRLDRHLVGRYPQRVTGAAI